MSLSVEKVVNRDRAINIEGIPESRNTVDEFNFAELPSVIVESPRKLKGLVWGAVVAAILSSTFLFALDNTIVADIQPKIIQDLGDIDKLPWVSVSFALGGVSTNLVWGKIYGQYNNKTLFLVGVLLFEIGSIACGSAQSLNALIVGRAICGLGGSGMYIGALNIISGLTTVTERPLYMSYIGATWGAGTVLGPIVGGAIADSKATWRWTFYLNPCVAGAAAPILLWILPTHQPLIESTLRKRFLSTDFGGILLMIGAFVSGIMAIAFGGALYPWRSGQIIGLFVCSALLWIIFGVQQASRLFTDETNQLFPIEYMKSKEMCILFAQAAAGISCVFIPIYFIPLFFQFVYNESALEAGTRLLPFVFVLVFAAMLNGGLMAKLGYYVPWFTFGGLLVVSGSALLYSIRFNSATATIYGYSVLTAFGAGLYTQAPFSIAQAKVEPSSVSRVTAFINCGQISGIVLSLAISSSIYVNQATQKVSAILPDIPSNIVQQAIIGGKANFLRELSTGDRLKVLEAIISTIDNLYIMVIVGGALTVILSVFLKWEKLFSAGPK